MSPWSPLPGDALAVRAAAADLQHVVPQLRTAHVAAVRLEELLDGAHWQGLAFDAFARVVERKPLASALERAIDAMQEAAVQLRWFADRFEAGQLELDHLRRQAEAVQAAIDPDDPATAEAAAAELRSLEQRAHAVHDEHRGELDRLAAAVDALSEEPTFAQPPPSNWERMTGAVGDVLSAGWSFGTGVVEGTRDLVLGIYEVAKLMDPARWPEIWELRDELWAVARYAWDDPVGFTAALGTGLLDLETLREDPARWLGRRVPDLLLSLATVGAGTVGARAAAAVRGTRGLRVADRTHLAHHGSGAFARTDTPLGRLATVIDAGVPGAGVGRQLPGLVLSEIRGFTDIPVDAALRVLPDGVGQLAGPPIKRTFASWATGGLTADLGILDGLLVGAPALSPASYATLTGIEVLSRSNDIAGWRDNAELVLDLPARSGRG